MSDINRECAVCGYEQCEFSRDYVFEIGDIWLCVSCIQTELATKTAALEAAEGRLREATGLAREVCRRLKEPSETHQESELRKLARAFLAPAPPQEPKEPPKKPAGIFMDKADGTPYYPKNPLGETMMDLRNQAIAKGMTLLSAEEITGEDMVMVRREDLESYLTLNSLDDATIQEWIEAKDRLKTALDGKKKRRHDPI